MTLDTIRDRLPDYAKDLKLNLSSLLNDGVLSEQQRWGTLLATALASRNAALIAAVSAEAAQHLSPAAAIAAKAAASIMAMNNIYYRFTHLASDPDYATMPARLRMNVIANPASTRAISSCGRSPSRRSMAAANASTPMTRRCARPAARARRSSKRYASPR
jgi:AhpD family alkylhydroperoxidase